MPRRALAATVSGAVVAALVGMPATPAHAVSTTIVINEVYGGGGNSGATYTNDFIELKNVGTTTIDISTWSVQYASASGTSYAVTPLTGQIPPGGSYLVEEAKGSGGTTPLPDPDANGTIAMSGTAGKVALVSNQTALSCGADCDKALGVVDFVGYGGANDSETAPTAAPSNTTSASRNSAGADTDNNSADFATGAASPVSCGPACDAPAPPPPPPACGDAATFIHQIQGSGAAFDPAFGGTRTVEGVVTAAMLGGVFLQEEAVDVDTDPLTSEAIFVFLSGRAAPTVGSVVRATGTVAEFGGKTQLGQVTAVEPCDGDAPAITATPVTFPLASPGDLERYEGMQVRLVDELVISESFNYDRFGEVVVALPPNGWNRLYTPTAVVEPGDEARALAAEYKRRTITIDDRSTAQNPSVIPHPGNGEPFSLTNRFRAGDTVTGIEGIMDQAFGAYRLQPTEYGTYTAKNPRPADAPAVGGRVQVASFNVLNYFLTLDRGTNQCGAHLNLDCRGANDETEFQRQRAKILAALAELDADVVGLMEMENSPGVEPGADLVAGLNERLGAGTYDYLDTGVIGTDAIRVGMLYKPGAVRPVGRFDVLDSSDDPRFDDQKSRPMLTQSFDEISSGARFTVSVNHLKSKGSACAGDADLGDGQGNCNQTRTRAAQAIVDHLAGDPTESGDPDQLIIGDLNSYDHEDPIDALVAGGFTDLVEKFGGEYAYGYVFNGMVGYLDHALSTPSLTPQVTGAAEWHINADEPDILDYDMSFKPNPIDALYAPDPYRSSDHDAVLVGLDLTTVTAANCYSDGAQRVASYDPGRRANGTEVPRPFTDPSESLGLSEPDHGVHWTTLGLDGEIVHEFSRPVQNNNGDAADLRIVDAGDGAKGGADSANVYASWDGVTWVQVGQVSGTGEVDLGELSAARYVKIVDTTDQRVPRATDGYDLDAVEVQTGCA